MAAGRQKSLGWRVFPSPLATRQAARFSTDNDPKNGDNDRKEDFRKRLEDLRLGFVKIWELLEQKFITVTVAVLLLCYVLRNSTQETSFDEVLKRLDSGEFESLHIDQRTKDRKPVKTLLHLKTKQGTVTAESLDDEILMKKVFERKKHIDSEERVGNPWRITQATTDQEKLQKWLGTLTIIGLVSSLAFPMLLSKSSTKMPTFEKQMNYKINKFNKESNLKVRFKDVAGINETKLEIEEFVDFLRNPEKYRAVGAKLPKGALLSGPPGTGKTLLAKAVAGEAGVPFYFASGSEFVEMFVGLGAKRVRELFAAAKKEQPAIIFIDEIDAIGKKRAGKLSNNSEGDATLNQLLVEMDGFSSSSNVIVFAATNRKDLLDPALLRPGRFDRTVDINLPDISARKEMFLIHLKPIKLAEQDDRERYAKRLAALTPGFSGADIANVCNEAAIHAVRRGKEAVEDWDFEMAVERVVGGLQMSKKPSKQERQTVAVHESGHGVVSWFLKGAAPLLKLTIIPRSKGALGFAQYLPNEIPLQSKEYLTNQIVSVLAGRAAEREFFSKVSTGAYDDLQKAYRIARAIVTKLGMDSAVGQTVYVENDYGVKDYSDAQNRLIDEQIQQIITECTATAASMVKEHRAQIQRMSDELLEKETLTLREIQAILGERPFPPEKVFEAYLEEVSVKTAANNV